ncbi:MAG: hypothetical protein KH438_03785, partial [Oscillibacter sp.]|nr:hypothetical protein [Oscillibacter sp.]
MSDVLRIGGIVSHAHLVHQSADGLGVHGVRALGKFFGKAAQGLIDRLVGPGHEVESGKSGLQFAGDSGPGVFLQLQKRQSGVAQGGGQPRAHLLQFLIAAPGPLGIGLEVFLHSGPPGQKFRAAPQNGAPGRRRLGRGEGHFLPLLACAPFGFLAQVASAYFQAVGQERISILLGVCRYLLFAIPMIVVLAAV